MGTIIPFPHVTDDPEVPSRSFRFALTFTGTRGKGYRFEVTHEGACNGNTMIVDALRDLSEMIARGKLHRCPGDALAPEDDEPDR
jgi:hypothetical protein